MLFIGGGVPKFGLLGHQLGSFERHETLGKFREKYRSKRVTFPTPDLIEMGTQVRAPGYPSTEF